MADGSRGLAQRQSRDRWHAQFISQATAGRLAGIVTGMIDGVFASSEDAYLAIKDKARAAHVPLEISDLVAPTCVQTSTALNTDWLARIRRSSCATPSPAMIEPNRAHLSRQGQGYPYHGCRRPSKAARVAVEYGLDRNTRNWHLGRNEGFNEHARSGTIAQQRSGGRYRMPPQAGGGAGFDLKFFPRKRSSLPAAGVTIGRCTE